MWNCSIRIEAQLGEKYFVENYISQPRCLQPLPSVFRLRYLPEVFSSPQTLVHNPITTHLMTCQWSSVGILEVSMREGEVRKKRLILGVSCLCIPHLRGISNFWCYTAELIHEYIHEMPSESHLYFSLFKVVVSESLRSSRSYFRYEIRNTRSTLKTFSSKDNSIFLPILCLTTEACRNIAQVYL